MSEQTLTGNTTIASGERILQHAPQIELRTLTAEESQSIERVCVNCAKWHIEYEQDFSEVTPGKGFSMWCEESVYNIDGGDIGSDEDFRDLILKARTCADFTPCTAAQKEALKRP